VRGSRAENGDVTITWIRRTRIGGDSWEGAEVPLAETQEAYAIDVVSGPDVVRSLGTSSPSFVYSASEQVADFGSPQAALSLRVAQVSATFGRGIAAHATV
jgi:hypothetical protein